MRGPFTGITPDRREGNIDNVPDSVPANHPPVLSRVMAAARVALDGVTPAATLTPLQTVDAVRSLAEPVAHQAGDYTVVDVPLRFEAAEMIGRVSYNQAGEVAGLYFLNQPSWSAVRRYGSN